MKKNFYIGLSTAIASLGLVLGSCSENETPAVEIPPVEEAYIEINGGGSTYPNMVFVDLSKEEQTAVRRDSWDLAFSTDTEFKVLINGTAGAMAYETAFTSFSAVDEALEAQLKTGGKLAMSFNNLEGILRIDNPTNPLKNGNVLGQAASSEQTAKVFILSRGENNVDVRPWKKIKIFRSNSNYVIQYAPINSNEFTSVGIAKDGDYNFVYFSFETGKVNVEPKKSDWDFVWSAGTSTTAFPQAVNGTLAYFFQDLVFHNIYGGVTAVEVLESDLAFDGVTLQAIAGMTFNAENRLAIGSNWRNTNPAAHKEGRYYIIKDQAGNNYKLRFLSMTTGGERGRPSLEYALIR